VRRSLWLLLLTVVLLAGCGADRAPDPPAQARRIAVLLDHDATEAQKADLRSRLEALPDVDGVLFESRQAGYRRALERVGDDPELRKALEAMAPATFPESFVLQVSDRAVFERLRDGPFASEIEARPGVADVVFPCDPRLAPEDCPAPG
jgi:cell division protein FtsX